MVKHVSPEYQDALIRALNLPPAQRIAMIEDLAASFRADQENGDEDQTFTDEEIAELTHVDPLPPAEIVAQGLLGSWSGLGIDDGAAWVNEKKRERKEHRKWQPR